jgi:four helix bundle protein
MSLVDRTLQFSLDIVRLHAELPVGGVRFVLGDQLLSSGTSPAAHFRESLRARSKAEYVAKLNSGLMELEETVYWLELLRANEALSSARIDPVISEAKQLIAIFVSQIKKWKPKPKK